MSPQIAGDEQRERSVLAAVWNASQTGDPKVLGIPLREIKGLCDRGLLETWLDSRERRFFLVTAEGKRVLGA
ncbi:MAG TPA: hypothetical protein VN736_28760 [Candidatus Limnocylindrales bacterium]|nr:hypothetical protein [Candidatus Limnocylindrales bacterium]